MVIRKVDLCKDWQGFEPYGADITRAYLAPTSLRVCAICNPETWGAISHSLEAPCLIYSWVKLIS
jgi:hypothetical protein